MARKARSSKLETRTARLKLPVQRKPYFTTIAPGISVGYRRNAGAGTWSVRAADGAGGNYLKGFAVADDFEESNGETVLDFWAAQDKARALARGGNGISDRPATVAEAIDAYEIDLKARGASIENAKNIRFNMPATLAARPVALLTARDLRDWRNGMVTRGSKPASADRIARVLKAALNLAASNDPQRITNSQAWRDGLKKLPDGETARNVILPDATVLAIVRTCYDADHALGVFVETLASTGARESQVLRVEVSDLQDDPIAPRLMMPSSMKGKGRRIDRKPLPISSDYAALLRHAAAGRPPHALLFDPIPRLDLRFREVTTKLGLASDVTPYSLRHSSIVRQLLAGIPTRVVASFHDTSVAMIEQNYSKYIIGDPSDAMTRRTLLDFTAPQPAPNVVPIAGRK